MTEKAILFDLDGTLADTAPDLINALNCLLKERGKPAVSYREARSQTSRGARGLISYGLGLRESDFEKEEGQALVSRFLELYSQRLHAETNLFPNAARTLKHLSRHGIAWGIVTNKRQAFAEPLLRYFSIDRTAACLVYGDTTDAQKPSPKPLLHAAELISKAPEACIYIGDSERDVQAAKAAGMVPAIVAYGYEINSDSDKDWDVDIVLNDIGDVIQYI